MKTIAEIAEEMLMSPKDFKTRATTLRRLSSGVRAELDGAARTGLTDKEQSALNAAAVVLSTLAAKMDGAGKLKQKERAAVEAMEVRARAAMKDTFYQLTSIPDQVALIAATASYQVQHLASLTDLDYYFKENIEHLAYRMAKEALSGDLTQVAAGAWTRFQDTKPTLQDKHAQTIGRLVTAAGRDA